MLRVRPAEGAWVVRSAELLFVNGAVHTVDASRPMASAVAISDGTIVAVGTDDEVRELAGPRTEVIDLRGRTVLPGFQDAHAHPPAAGLELLRCNLTGEYSIEGYERVIGAYASENPEVPWIVGGGWAMDVFPNGNPDAEVLDRILPGRPAYLVSRDGHSAWVNAQALEIAGVSAATPDPADGWVVRDASSAPTGTLHEGAKDLVERHVPEATEADWIEGLRVAQRFLHGLGITAWQDAIVGASYPTLDAYLAFAGSGELTARVVGALWWDRHRGLEQIEDLRDARERGRAGRFAATTVKIMQDGVIENHTAAMLEPYLDPEGTVTGQRGTSFVDPAELAEAVTRLDAEGFQVHVHAIGDRAVREALDAFGAARAANGPNDHRHHVAHLQVVHPQDLPRFAELGVVANAQPLWAVNEGQMLRLTVPFLGPERSGRQYPWASLLRSGARLAMGSDWSVSSPDPLWGIHVAVHRTPPPGYPYGEGTTETFLPAERIDLATAVAAYTLGSAFVNQLDDVTGSIEIGKDADLVALDRDLFASPPEAIAEARVLLTLVAGERVHAAGDLA